MLTRDLQVTGGITSSFIHWVEFCLHSTNLWTSPSFKRWRWSSSNRKSGDHIDKSRSHTYTSYSCSCSEKMPINMKIDGDVLLNFQWKFENEVSKLKLNLLLPTKCNLLIYLLSKRSICVLANIFWYAVLRTPNLFKISQLSVLLENYSLNILVTSIRKILLSIIVQICQSVTSVLKNVWTVALANRSNGVTSKKKYVLKLMTSRKCFVYVRRILPKSSQENVRQEWTWLAVIFSF